MTTATQLYAELDKVKDAALNTLREQIQRFGGKVDLDALGCAFEDEVGSKVIGIDSKNCLLEGNLSYPYSQIWIFDAIAIVAQLEKHCTLPNPAQQFVAKVNEEQPGTFPDIDGGKDVTDYSNQSGGEVIVK